MITDSKTFIKYVFGLIEFYHYIDFNSLSKFEIKDKPINNDAELIFMVSNVLNELRKGNYTITKKDKLYHKKILKTNGLKNT
jgi:hypothetical protein